MKVELLYLDGCPNHEALLPRLRDLIEADCSEVDIYDDRTKAIERVNISSRGEQARHPPQPPTPDQESPPDCTSPQAVGTGDSPVSDDGRFVVFTSSSANLVEGDTNSVSDVFVRDRERRLTRRVTTGVVGQEADGASAGAGLSADGRYITFSSAASNLVAADTNACPDVFVHDQRTGRTKRVSLRANGTQRSVPSDSARISADGRSVVYVTEYAFDASAIFVDGPRWRP